MSALLDKLKESRRQIVESGGFAFKIERPTAVDMQRLRGDLLVVDAAGRGREFTLALLRFVVDWPGMRELDILPGGTGVAVPFESDAFMAWVSDQPIIADELAGVILQSWLDHNAAIEAAQKKPSPGISPENLADQPAEN